MFILDFSSCYSVLSWSVWYVEIGFLTLLRFITFTSFSFQNSCDFRQISDYHLVKKDLIQLTKSWVTVHAIVICVNSGTVVFPGFPTKIWPSKGQNVGAVLYPSKSEEYQPPERSHLSSCPFGWVGEHTVGFPWAAGIVQNLRCSALVRVNKSLYVPRYLFSYPSEYKVVQVTV